MEPLLLALNASLFHDVETCHQHNAHARPSPKVGRNALTCLSLYKSCSSEVDTFVAAGAPRRLRCLRFDPDAMPLRAACTVMKSSRGDENRTSML